jgi:hypothetical protein
MGGQFGDPSDPTFREVLHREDPPVWRDPAPCRHSVYFLIDREAAQVKIGYTSDVQRRVRDLSHERGNPLELAGEISGDSRFERILHERFRPYRIMGTREWYSTEIMRDIFLLLACEQGNIHIGSVHG